jgi:uncharacterized protein YjbJ (UPF0337 family)
MAGKWHVWKGRVRELLGKLTRNEVKQLDGKKEQLLGKLQSRYGEVKSKLDPDQE